jgi:hypothetical protein
MTVTAFDPGRPMPLIIPGPSKKTVPIAAPRIIDMFDGTLLVTPLDASGQPIGPGVRVDKKAYGDCRSATSNTIVYQDLDHLKRAQGAYACYVTEPTDGTDATRNPIGFVPGMSRGHLIARSLGGDGGDLRNLVPIYQNRPNSAFMYHRVEKFVRSRVAADQVVYYQVTPLYKGNDLIPYQIDLFVGSSDGDEFACTIENDPYGATNC